MKEEEEDDEGGKYIYIYIKKGSVPQEFLEVSPSNAKNDTSLAGAPGLNCRLQQIVGHRV